MGLIWWLLLLILALVAVFCVGLFVDRRRGEVMENLARRLDFGFAPKVEPEYHRQYEAFWPFGQGDAPHVSNLLYGQTGRIRWEAFDYRYLTGEAKSKTAHEFGVIVATAPVSLPKTLIRPRGQVEPLTYTAAMEELTGTGEEFARRFHVASSDLARAGQVLQGRVEEFLLGAPPATWQLEGDLIVLSRPRLYSPAEIQQRMKMVEGLLARLPRELLKDATVRAAPSQLPGPVQ